jgi:hypothetical protein
MDVSIPYSGVRFVERNGGSKPHPQWHYVSRMQVSIVFDRSWQTRLWVVLEPTLRRHVKPNLISNDTLTRTVIDTQITHHFIYNYLFLIQDHGTESCIKNPLIVTSIPSEVRWSKGANKPIICCRASTCTCTSAVWCSCSICMPCYWENGLRSPSAAPWVSVKKLFGSIWVLCMLRMKALLPTAYSFLCVKINESFGCEMYEESLKKCPYRSSG